MLGPGRQQRGQGDAVELGGRPPPGAAGGAPRPDPPPAALATTRATTTTTTTSDRCSGDPPVAPPSRLPGLLAGPTAAAQDAGHPDASCQAAAAPCGRCLEPAPPSRGLVCLYGNRVRSPRNSFGPGPLPATLGDRIGDRSAADRSRADRSPAHRSSAGLGMDAGGVRLKDWVRRPGSERRGGAAGGAVDSVRPSTSGRCRGATGHRRSGSRRGRNHRGAGGSPGTRRSPARRGHQVRAGPGLPVRHRRHPGPVADASRSGYAQPRPATVRKASPARAATSSSSSATPSRAGAHLLLVDADLRCLPAVERRASSSDRKTLARTPA